MGCCPGKSTHRESVLSWGFAGFEAVSGILPSLGCFRWSWCCPCAAYCCRWFCPVECLRWQGRCPGCCLTGQQSLGLGQQVSPQISPMWCNAVASRRLRRARNSGCDESATRGATVSRSTIYAGVAAVVLFLWLGGERGWAVLVVLAGLGVYAVDCAVFDEAPCSGGLFYRCDRGKIWSPGSRTFRRHKKCGATGFRPRLARRLWNREGNQR